MMQETTLLLPACFSSGEKQADEPLAAAAKPGQAVIVSMYQTKIAGQCRSIMVTWCKNLLVHGLSVSVQGPGGEHLSCKLEVWPWHFWRRQGSKRFFIDGVAVDVFWDLKAAKFGSEAEPLSDFYVAMVCEEEVVLLVGDLKKEAYRRTGSPPSLIDAMLVSKEEHIFGKKRFSTRAKFQERGRFHEISIECHSNNSAGSSELIGPEMAIKVDGHSEIRVTNLQWKFRGNESISINKIRVEVYWDVHAWLFSPGLRHALFIFKPISSVSSSPLSPFSSSISTSSEKTTTSGSIEANNGNGSSGFCLFLYAWRSD